MELTKHHRQTLLSELEKAKTDLKINTECLSQDDREGIKSFFEMSMFLAQQRITLIEQSLINNEIDF